MSWAKTNIKWLGTMGFFGVFLLSLLTLATVFQPFASAANLGDRALEYSYFYNQYTGGRGWHQVIPGGIPNTADKTTFTNFIIDRYYNGSQQQKTGAAFIINLQLGRPGAGSNRNLTGAEINDWVNRINQPQVSFNMEFYGFTYNSAYDTPTDDDLFYFEPDVRWALVVRYNGAIVSVIKQDCANPLDGNSGIPFAPPQWSLSASASAPGSVFPGQTITFSYNIHNNGPDSAPITQYGTRYELYNGGTGQGWANTPGPGDASETLPPGGDISTHRTWSYTVPSNYSGNRVCSWISYIPTSSGNGGWSESNHFCVNISQPVPSCSAMNPIPATIEPANPFNIYASVTYQNQPAAYWSYQSGGRLFVSVTGPGGYNVDSGSAMNFGPPTAADISGISPQFPATGISGSFVVTYGIRGGAIGNITCTAPTVPPLTIGYHPYFRVDAGNISAGAGFTKADGTCSASTAAGIRGLNNGSGGSPAFLGAGAQLGALALGVISGFPTSTNEGGGSSGVGAGTGTGLTFANTPSLGSFGTLPCTTDYATDALAAAATVTPLASGSYNLATLSSGTYQVTSGNVSLSGNIPSGRQVTIVVMGGNAILTGNVNYGGYSSPSDAPQFKLIVTNGGNIKVKNDVTELHGVYIALPNTTVSPTTGGALSTCYDTAAGADTVDYNMCKYKLTFYGAVLVNTLLLERTYGSLVANPSQGVVAQASEVFNDSPELWAAPGSSNTPTGIQTYDSIVSLPPVL